MKNLIFLSGVQNSSHTKCKVMTQRQTLEINTTFQINDGRSEFFRKDIGNNTMLFSQTKDMVKSLLCLLSLQISINDFLTEMASIPSVM